MIHHQSKWYQILTTAIIGTEFTSELLVDVNTSSVAGIFGIIKFPTLVVMVVISVAYTSKLLKSTDERLKKLLVLIDK